MKPIHIYSLKTAVTDLPDEFNGKNVQSQKTLRDTMWLSLTNCPKCVRENSVSWRLDPPSSSHRIETLCLVSYNVANRGAFMEINCDGILRSEFEEKIK